PCPRTRGSPVWTTAARRLWTSARPTWERINLRASGSRARSSRSTRCTLLRALCRT
ncbi:unnamed protein product, partial [Effrenium voratum]